MAPLLPLTEALRKHAEKAAAICGGCAAPSDGRRFRVANLHRRCARPAARPASTSDAAIRERLKEDGFDVAAFQARALTPADVRGVTLDTIARQTTANALALFSRIQ